LRRNRNEKSEINSLVAEKIMDWAVNENTPYGDIFIDNEGSIIPLFYPSWQMEDAWKVVEKLREKGMLIKLYEADQHYSAFFRKVGSFYFDSAEADSAPMAICLAALKTVGVEV